MLTFILQPYSRVNTENPYPILDLFPDLLMLMGLCKVVVLPAVPIFKCPFTRKLSQTKFSSNSLVLRKMISYSRPKLSDFYTLFESKLAENHTLHSGTYLYSSYMGVPPCELKLPGTLTCVPVYVDWSELSPLANHLIFSYDHHWYALS